MLRPFAAALAALLIAAPAIAENQAGPPPANGQRIAATVVKLEGAMLWVKTDAGEDLTLVFPADARVTRSNPGTLADVKPGLFIGCTAIEGTDGKLHAIEIHILPEAMRGVGEGHYPWGDVPNQTMTNGNIENVAGITDGHVVKVSYKGGISEIVIPPDVKVTVVELRSASDLKPGTKVSIYAVPDADGTLSARYVRLVS
jgi:hypothetical protein